MAIMEAILEIQQLARKSSTDIVDLVRSAYIVATELEMHDFADWCNAELNGYFNCSSFSIPAYRKGGVLFVYYDDRGLKCKKWTDKEQQEILSQKYIGDSLSSLMRMLDKDYQKISVELSPSLINYYNKIFDHYQTQHLPLVYGDIDVIQQALSQNCKPSNILELYINENDIYQIKDTVQNKILTWSLECKKQGILGKEWQFSPKEKAMAQNVTYNINTLQNMANHNTESTINQTAQNMLVTKGDLQSLVSFLSDKGISEPDIQEFKEIIDIEPNITMDGIQNSKIQQWLGKIAIGGSLVAKGVAIDVIVEAIKQFF